jgi:hypothetical protein
VSDLSDALSRRPLLAARWLRAQAGIRNCFVYRGICMSILLMLVGLIVFIVGLPWLAAAFGMIAWGTHRLCCAFVTPRPRQQPPFA